MLELLRPAKMGVGWISAYWCFSWALRELKFERKNLRKVATSMAVRMPLIKIRLKNHWSPLFKLEIVPQRNLWVMLLVI